MTDSLEILKKEEKDLDIIKQIMAIKSNLTAYLQPKELIDEVITLIDNSEIFDFKSQRNRKYINEKRPLFVVKSKSDKHIKELYPHLNNITDREKLISESVHLEIVSKLSDYLVKRIKDTQTLTNIIQEEITEEILETSILISFLTASIFSINCDFASNTIYIEYMI